MKTKKILGLGICALSLGMVAGVIGTRAAVEAKAVSNRTIYMDYSAVNDANAKVALWTWGGEVEAGWSEPTVVEAGKYFSFQVPADRTGFTLNRYDPTSQTPNNQWGRSADLTFEADKDLLTVTWSGENGVMAAAWGTYTPSAPVVYTVKIGDGAPVELIKNTSASMATGQKAEYYVENKNVKKGDALVFAADTVAITSHIGGDEGSNTVFTTIEEVTSAKIHNDKDNANIYFKVWNDGGYSVYVTGYAEGPTGWYICNDDTWGPADGKLSEGSNAQNAAYWLDVKMAAGYEFTIAEFADGERVQQYDLGWSNVAEDWSSEYAKFEAGASDNHIKVKTAGVYSIYVTSGETKKICLNGSGLTPDVIKKAGDLAAYINEKGAESTEGMSGDERIASCTTKYNKAIADYNDLGEAGQKYFRDNYGSQYAKMELWHTAVSNQNSLYNVSGLAASNPTLIITISVIAGAAVAGAGIYLISKKRKHN